MAVGSGRFASFVPYWSSVQVIDLDKISNIISNYPIPDSRFPIPDSRFPIPCAQRYSTGNHSSHPYNRQLSTNHQCLKDLFR
ncbi:MULTISPECIES: hypothetical protein [Moorena]|uniref:hypothetical protein n=1 Tax=Moorena TaxID=1155738 RepID=UPI0002D6CB8D|nr:MULTISPECIES: hypothetical protein [Moorena]NEQ16424.1 hypothetical protein [Moorena sp. SIO3E2]NEP31793.1 hypothetical protein [Moorena sp. SIO3B2]NEP69905.1 hypothetical protein [Moorena sp. SIO3A5]NEQ07624.1 hypothetical protein [Moorena sp. SIO4E2]NER89356.1 hypothetical protein [Moorena sp. SIO3A2]